MSECSIPECEKPSRTRGWCNLHWLRWRKNGTPLRPSRTERFWQNVNMAGGPSACWPWKLSTNWRGYGQTTVAGKMVGVHRLAYELAVGPIPEGLTLDHLCHNADKSCVGGNACLHRRCANPAHLEPVTSKENILRGVGITARAARTTHCPSGHPYDLLNTYINPRGSRTCRTCSRASRGRLLENGYFRQYYQANKERWAKCATT